MTFQVVYMTWSLDEFRDLFQRAKKVGLAPQVLTTGREIDRRLHDDPVEFGDPTYSLRHLKLQFYA